MITEFPSLLEKFQNNFLETIKTKNSWGKNEVKEVFDKEYVKLLMNMVESTLHRDKS